ncbi:hypothetical protein [Oceanobacillus polygoni]|uniref:ABC-type antimicrobial peptide transport system permease subunit n=1 Tax=Oceanobacillus polygoni TaxID=1235259 RepID=A0A9X0YPI5_9BACI|nr:hypothetical protein [Oceanobacillus polygoni]MBP2076338.1 ABC-type antimicrobial peptide transport system permease subunit [Oceanobacillus polygoni]
MKKYIAFAISFLFAYPLLQISSGMLLTFTYTPDIEEAWNQSATMAQEAIISSSPSSFSISLLIAFLAASIAYFIANKFRKVNAK